jgi:hypothetical protein
LVKVKLNEFPGDRPFESKAPWSAVTVCVALPLFVHVILVPTETLRVAGLKAKLMMLTLDPLPLGVEVAGVGVTLLLVGVLATVVVAAGVGVGVGVGVDPPVGEVPQAERLASRVRMIRPNPAGRKKRNGFFCIDLALLK